MTTDIEPSHTPLNSKDDIVAEIILITQHNFKAYGKYEEYYECIICLESTHEKYVLQYPCGHVFHRNCALTSILQYKKLSCPFCSKYPERISNTTNTSINTSNTSINTSNTSNNTPNAPVAYIA